MTPARIICLTEETVETLYLMGEGWRIVGVSGFVVRPPEARRKPKVSTFTDAKVDEILALRPDLVFTFSDIQAEITANLMRAGLEVHAFNHRTVAGIFAMIRTLGALIGEPAKADALSANLQANIDAAREKAKSLTRRPRVYFEEWDEPMISAIGWVSELIEIAGGENVFASRAFGQAARDRFVTSEEVIAAAPDIIIGSWCGKGFKKNEVMARPDWDAIPAVTNGRLYEIKSSIILQPGPAALSDGLADIVKIIDDAIRP
ncbi:MAG: cobalamin-binding protein [Alphaproteobacteria bacterium RIFCSPHIGHO2_12_FULL_63_12]|nr:MAG: cobalamin-binding protein [Alphaproteobacteria bacterium RIFCSPHIGHO2_12_FULL_63_12]